MKKTSILQTVAIIAPIMFTIIGASWFLSNQLASHEEQIKAVRAEAVSGDALLMQLVKLNKEKAEIQFAVIEESNKDLKEKIKEINKKISNLEALINTRYATFSEGL